MDTNAKQAKTTVRKVNSADAAVGSMGQKYLACGSSTSMRMWDGIEPNDGLQEEHERSYEVLGYVIAGEAELSSAGETVLIQPGDCWVVPKGVKHSYKINKSFTAVESAAPPARHGARDKPALSSGDESAETCIDKTLDSSFPASDPPGWSPASQGSA